MQNTMSQPASSGSESTIFVRSFASGSAFARVRFHTLRSQPPFARRRAISKPMRPVPIQPSFALSVFAEINSIPPNSFRSGLDHREHGSHRHRGARLDQNRLEHAARNGGNFSRHLVGFDVEERLVRFDAVADFLVPVRHGTLGNRFAQLRHDHIHSCFLLLTATRRDAIRARGERRRRYARPKARPHPRADRPLAAEYAAW